MMPLALLVPEITLAVLSMGMLLVGLFATSRERPIIEYGAIASLALVLSLVWSGNPFSAALTPAPEKDYFLILCKSLVLLCSIACVWMGQAWFHGQQRVAPFEYYILIMLSALGMMIMISADSLLMLYIGLELQSLPLYILTAMRRDDTRTAEAALKYFVLGALASGILLYGLSLLYGALGSVDYAAIASSLEGDGLAAIVQEPLFLFGLVFTIAGFAFKISAAPFHMWTPDVYQGAPLSVTAFLASAPKIAALAMLMRFLAMPMADVHEVWQQIIMILAVLSVMVGAFTAIMQTNLMRLLAFSSIGHMGYVLMGIAAGTEQAYTSVLYYMMIYAAMTIGVFATLLSLRKNNYFVSDINDLSGLSKTHPALAFALAALFLSLAGIPPLAGFFGKLYVFQAALAQELYTMVIIGVLGSVVAAYYYLRMCKVMYFDDVIEEQGIESSRPLMVMATTATTFVVLFSLFPAAVLYDAAVLATTSLAR